MKNEEKCFFSISLENGIVITGKNPHAVKNFLCDLSIICADAVKECNSNMWNEYTNELKRNFDEAWLTIYNNLKK